MLLRSSVGARYEIVSDSMAPLLSAARHDQVLVDKQAFRDRAPDPFEIVVLRVGEDRTPVVKRAVAVGPGRVALRSGDVFFDRLDGSGFQRLQRDPRDPLGSVRPVWTLRISDSFPFSGPATVVRDRLRIPSGSVVRTTGAPFGDHPGSEVPGRSSANDFGLEVQPNWMSELRFLEVSVRLDDVVDVVRITADGAVLHARVRRDRDLPGLIDTDLTDTGLRLEVPPKRITVQRLDGRLCVHGGSGALWTAPLSDVEPRTLVLPGDEPLSEVSLRGESADGSDLVLAGLSLIADVHYPPEQQAFELGADELFVLGDDPSRSEDSRVLRGAPFHRRQLIGRVLAALRGGQITLAGR